VLSLEGKFSILVKPTAYFQCNDVPESQYKIPMDLSFLETKNPWKW